MDEESFLGHIFVERFGRGGRQPFFKFAVSVLLALVTLCLAEAISSGSAFHRGLSASIGTTSTGPRPSFTLPSLAGCVVLRKKAASE